MARLLHWSHDYELEHIFHNYVGIMDAALMTLDDPARPRIGDRPTLLNAGCIVPALQIYPLERGVRVSVLLPVEPNSFSWFERILGLESTDELGLDELMVRYHANPEDCLHTIFGWTAPTKPQAKLDTLSKLKSLGLIK